METVSNQFSYSPAMPRSLAIADATQLQDPYFAAALAAANNTAVQSVPGAQSVNDLANVAGGVRLVNVL